VALEQLFPFLGGQQLADVGEVVRPDGGLGASPTCRNVVEARVTRSVTRISVTSSQNVAGVERTWGRWVVLDVQSQPTYND